jgi:predicted phosphodiesterase
MSQAMKLLASIWNASRGTSKTGRRNRRDVEPDRLQFLLGGVFLALFISIAVISTRHTTRSIDSLNKPWRLEFHATQSTTTSLSFKILQLADIHLGENYWEDWGPVQDIKTWHVLDSVILAEEPDLIVLSGDQLTANNVDENATAFYRLLGERLSYYGYPWALIFGNHDDAPLENKLPNGTIVKTVTKTSRQQLLAVDQEFPLSLTQSTPGIFGTSNYELNIHYPSSYQNNGDYDVAFQLFFLDTGGGTLTEQLEQNQIDWFLKTHRRDVLGAAVFQHIPTAEFVYDGAICRGLHDNGNYPVENDPGIVKVLQESGNVKWLAVGHLHGSDFCCSTDGDNDLHLCFGRHSGYGGYGSWDRGARIYELQLNIGSTMSEEAAIEWRSYVRMENSSVIDRYEPTVFR